MTPWLSILGYCVQSSCRVVRNGNLVEYRQDPIPQSNYHTRLEDEIQNAGGPAALKSSEIRYWSDYSRISFHPRSLQKLPDHADWESLEGDWNAGREEFVRYDQVGCQVERTAFGLTTMPAGDIINGRQLPAVCRRMRRSSSKSGHLMELPVPT